MNYYVEAHTKDAEISEEFFAEDLKSLKELVRERFEYILGISVFDFTYDLVEDEDGNAITDEAKAC
jgi:hypothetical protein